MTTQTTIASLINKNARLGRVLTEETLVPASGAQVFYQRSLRDSYIFAGSLKDGFEITEDQIDETHIRLGSVSFHLSVGRGYPRAEQLFRALQGENYSPAGEASEILDRTGIEYTSMSVGDLVIYPDGTVKACGSFGWITGTLVPYSSDYNRD